MPLAATNKKANEAQSVRACMAFSVIDQASIQQPYLVLLAEDGEKEKVPESNESVARDYRSQPN
jgi:hypothetical protein